MNSRMKGVALIIASGFGLSTLFGNYALADSDSDSESFSELTSAWWQWALSIPTPLNPMLDPDGGRCMVGQRGSVWFLAGVFGGGTAVRQCSVPANAELFFPIVNSVNFNTPNVCGQGADNLHVSDLRRFSADFVDAATKLSLEVDGKAIKAFRRVESEIFDIALPEDNVFDAICISAGLGNVPAAIYSPAVDDGLYVKLHQMKVGNHTVHFHAEGAGGFVQDVTYHLTAVPVLNR